VVVLPQFRARRILQDVCLMCNLPKWNHTRDRLGNVVLKPEVRAIVGMRLPPVCYPGRLEARRVLELPEKPIFGRHIAR